jgi:hypothetical protein
MKTLLKEDARREYKNEDTKNPVTVIKTTFFCPNKSCSPGRYF